jgi:hypothetical protein
MSSFRRVTVIAGALGAVFLSVNALYGPKSPAAEFDLAFGGGVCVALAFGSMLKAKRQAG